MTQIKLTPEQAAIIKEAVEPIRICFPDGTIAGWVSSTMSLPPKAPHFTAEEIAEAERRADTEGPWYTTEEVLAHLRTLEDH